ncbi:16S ribosomal RNA methyltransferase RsmE [Bordetella ansorpii]|uniref:Ribosomal RNA small subunit methyltransferase E n=1 Tax=Bordetella ansorpii TaxID=288768 RepID=A0A157S5J3_9BORD|nr:16S rRNA (uracil(1498)-N(3))-methyltransferase [Bordetella ansorpii]SAI65682.1 16S ribosomal RNA methyltransferase RsmE [Bordetella ansorpii]
MSLPRFYCELPLVSGALLPLPEALAHHAVRVLRVRDGQDIVLFDGQGGEYPAVLKVQGRAVHAQLGEHRAHEAELAGAITLVQGLPSGDKMDWVVEKAVELGAVRVAPISAQRSVVQLSGARADKRLAHWRRIAQSAAEQCGRNRLMQVDAPCTLAQWLREAPQGPRLLCHPEAELSLAQVLAQDPAPRRISLLVGPEGGWSDTELQAARQAGTTAVRFGPRVLRTETAGLALMAAASALLDW